MRHLLRAAGLLKLALNQKKERNVVKQLLILLKRLLKIKKLIFKVVVVLMSQLQEKQSIQLIKDIWLMKMISTCMELNHSQA